MAISPLRVKMNRRREWPLSIIVDEHHVARISARRSSSPLRKEPLVSTTPQSPALKLPEFPWFLFLLLGVLCTILGIAGIVDLSMTFALGAYSVLFFGILFLINGVSHIVSGIFTRPLSSGILEILCGILYVLAGIFAITEPGLAAGIYTLILAISLIASGAVRVMM